MSVEAAVWYTEAALNYEHRYALFSFDSSVTYTISYDYSLNNNQLDAESLAEFYGILRSEAAGLEQLLVTNVYVSSATGDQLTLSADLIEAIDPFFVTSPRPISMNPRRAFNYNDCSSPSQRQTTTGYQQAANKALNQFKNSIGWHHAVYYHYTSVMVYSSLLQSQVRFITSENLVGGSSAVIPSHRNWQSTTLCLSGAEGDQYRQQIFDETTTLGDPISIRLDKDNGPTPWNNHYAWVYDEVVIGAQRQTIQSPN